METKHIITIMQWNELKTKYSRMRRHDKEKFSNNVPYFNISLLGNDEENLNFVHMIIEKNKVSAAAQLRYFKDETEGYMCIMSIGTCPEKRNKGYSKLLINSIMDQCKDLNKKLVLSSMTEDGNIKLKKLFISMAREKDLKISFSKDDKAEFPKEKFDEIMDIYVPQILEDNNYKEHFQKDGCWGMAIAIRELILDMDEIPQFALTKDKKHGFSFWNNKTYGCDKNLEIEVINSTKEFISIAEQNRDKTLINEDYKKAKFILNQAIKTIQYENKYNNIHKL